MPSKGEGIFLSDLAICVGIVDRKGEKKLAQLVELEQPQNVIIKPWKSEEAFKTGKWYRRMKKNGLWMEINDGLVPTRSKMDGLNTQIEMSLPVIFMPNFSASDISKLGGQFEFVDPLNAQRPICPLFGAGNNQILPIPSCGFRDKEGNSPLSGILYCARVQLSYSVGSLPKWSYFYASPNSNALLDKFKWSPVFEEEDSLYLHLFNSYCSEGIIVEKISLQTQNGGIQNCYLILDKNGQINIYLNKKDRTADLGKMRSFCPIRINYFKFPLNLALNFAPIKRNNGQSAIEQSPPVKIKKLNNLDYSIELNITREILAEFGPNAPIRLPFLGIISDPLSHIQKEKLKVGEKIFLEAKVQWHFKGEVAIWTVIECKIGDKIEANIGKNENGMKIEKESESSDSDEDIISMDFPIRPPLKNPSVASWVNDVGEFKILAVHFAMKLANGNAIFLEFCEKQKTFTARHDFNLRQDQKTIIGEWYWLKYSQPPMARSRRFPPIARELVKTDARCLTRTVLGICAQFSGCRQNLINIWHNSAKFCESTDSIKCDKWWPSLCTKCCPNLCKDVQFNSAANSPGGSSSIASSNLAQIHRPKPIQKKTNGIELLPNSSRLNSRQQNESPMPRANSEQKNLPSNPKVLNQYKLAVNRPPPIQITSNIFHRPISNNGPNLDGYGKPPNIIHKPIQKLPPKMSPIPIDGAMISENESDSSDESTLGNESVSLNISSSTDENQNPNLSAESQFQIDNANNFEVPKDIGKTTTTNPQNQPGGFGGGSRRRSNQFSAQNSFQIPKKANDNGNAALRLQNMIAPKNNNNNVQISTESRFSSMKMSGEGNSAGLNGSQRKVPPTNPFKIASSKTVEPPQSNDKNNISEALEANLDLDDDFE